MLEQESNFDLHELFFSKTDLKGIIQSGNAVFIRVSEFSEEELMKRPHNIIRHQDMPRSVFKLFWAFLKQGQPVAAYVKNKSKNGKYYWVFAMAFPLHDGYLSVRIKPTSALFSIARQLYQKLVYMEENGSSMDDSIQAAEEELRSAGFSSYEDFMMTALLQELVSRDALLKDTGLTRSSQLLDISDDCTSAARHSFTKISHLSEKLRDLIRIAGNISSICQDVKLVTMNLTVSSAKLGEQGRPLVAVSGNLEQLTAEISQNSQMLQEVFSKYEKSVLKMQFGVATARFQIEMMNHLAQEVCTCSDQCILLADESTQSFRLNCDLLTKLITTTLVNVGSTSSELLKVSKDLLNTIQSLFKTVNGIRVIHVVGKIEVARIPNSLHNGFLEMEGLTEKLKETLDFLKRECNAGLSICQEVDISYGQMTCSIAEINKLISSYSQAI